MNEPDSKKLIAGFLVLATITSSAAFALSGYLTTKANKNGGQERSSILNAFSKNKPEDLNKTRGQDTGNFTKNLADEIAKGILSSNQGGPQTRSGLNSIELPTDLEDILDKYVGDVEITEDIFAIDEGGIKINKNPSARDLEIYFKSLEDILRPSVEGDEIKNLKNKLKSSPDENTIGAMSLLYSEAQIKIYALEVPDKAFGFHASLLRALNVPLVVLGKNLKEDPLKSFALLQASEALFDSYFVELTKEYNILKIELKDLSLETHSNFEFIKTAHAQIPVTDALNWVENLMTQIAEWMRIPWEQKSFLDKLMISLIKERLLGQIVNGILNWAQGDIVSNWQDYLLKTFEAAADQYIQNAAQGFCTSYRNKLVEQLKQNTGAKSSLSLEGITARSALNVGCPLESIVSDIDLFYDDFSTGGWDAYDALTLPSSNYYSNLFLTQEKVLATAQDAKTARQMELVAGGGSAPTERCEDGTSPKNGVCSGGGTPEVTTPGQTKTSLIGTGLSSAIDRIVSANAEEWEDLALAIANSAINKLLTSGNKGIKRGNITGSAAGDPYAVCAGYPSGSEEYLACIDNVNDTQNTSNSGSSKADLLREANSLLDEASSTLSTILLSLDTVSSTIVILEEIKLSCPAQTTAAESELAILAEDYSRLLEKADSLLSRLATIQSFIEEVSSHDEDDSEFFRGKYRELNTLVDRAALARDRAEASGNLANFQSKLQNANNLLQQCAAP